MDDLEFLIPCLYFPNVGIRGLYRHVWFGLCWGVGLRTSCILGKPSTN